MACYEAAHAADDAFPWPALRLAWILSSCPDDAFHDGMRAVELARGALKSLPVRRADMAEILAAALARNGQFDEAASLFRPARSGNGSGPAVQRDDVDTIHVAT